MSYRIITNNSIVHRHLAGRYAVDLVSGDAQGVFMHIEQALQDGWQLLTSPLPPNVPLIRSSVRTVVLKQSSAKYDVPGLGCLAKAQERTAMLHKPHRPEQLGDLEHIDWTFVQRAMGELGLPAAFQG